MDFKDETSFRGMIHYNWFINNWFLINYQVFAGTSSHLYVSFACGKRKKTSRERTILLKTPNYRMFFTVGLLTEER